jgi:hypothetical protein
MSAKASILSNEIIRRADGVAVGAEGSNKQYESWWQAKEVLDETLILWLTTLQHKEYKLEATHGGFQLQVADDRNAAWTRYIEVQVVLNVV